MDNEILLRELIGEISRAADAIERLTANQEPGFIEDLVNYPGYDWSKIGAIDLERDKHGSIMVQYRGRVYYRRSPDNKFGPAVWYSRCTGKDEAGNNHYERLITFKEINNSAPDPLPGKVVRAIKDAINEAKESGDRKISPDDPAVDYTEYFKAAAEYDLTTDEARTLATLAGINFKTAFKKTDYKNPMRLLKIVKIRRDEGLTLASSMDLFMDTIDEFKGDTEKAIKYLEDTEVR